MIMAEEWISTV